MVLQEVIAFGGVSGAIGGPKRLSHLAREDEGRRESLGRTSLSGTGESSRINLA
jgi:hypothetical protein